MLPGFDPDAAASGAAGGPPAKDSEAPSADTMRRQKPLRRPLLPILLLVAPLLGLGASPLPAADASAGVRMFAEAMARMMEAMGMLGDGAPVPAPAPGAMPFGMGQMPYGGVPDMGAWMSQMPGVQLPSMPGWQRTGLDGIWEGRNGGLLIVQAHRFRLYSGHGDYVEGLIQQRGDRVALYDPEHDIARPYEFAQHQGRLVLRDAAGQVYLYRRLWLDAAGDEDTAFEALSDAARTPPGAAGETR